MPPKAAPRRGGAAAPRRTDTADSTGSSASPTPTPGPSSRPPVQRLQSLNKRTPGGSIPAKPSPLGPGGDGGEPAKPTLKYKPRAVGRRSKEERDAIEKLEAERHRERLKEAAAIQRGRNGPGGRGGKDGPGRGRGAFGGGRRGRGGRFGDGDSRASSISRSRSVIDMGSGAVSQDVSSDESDSGIRVSIDYINLESDDEEWDDIVDKKKGKIPARGGLREPGLRPVRVERLPHEERTVSVNMESSTSKPAEQQPEQAQPQAQEKPAEDDALFVPQDDAAKTVETEPRVKEEPTEDGDQIMTDAIPHVDDDGFLPAQKVKVRRNLSPKSQERQDQEQRKQQEQQEEQEQSSPSPPAAVKDPRSLLRTREEIEEYERHEQDLEEIRKLLITEPKKSAEPTESPTEAAPESTATEGQQDTPAENAEAKSEEKEEGTEEETEEDRLAGQLFLVQFPPMTPNLIVPGTDVADDVENTGATADATAPGQETAVKREDGDMEILDGAEEANPQARKVVTANDWQLSAGRAGKLNVHASGRLTMDWGGISFELDRATKVNFLQEALIMSAPDETNQEPDENRVWAMGQLSGKFTVTPDWAKML